MIKLKRPPKDHISLLRINIEQCVISNSQMQFQIKWDELSTAEISNRLNTIKYNNNDIKRYESIIDKYAVTNPEYCI